MSNTTSHLISLGYVAKAHGIKGELGVVLFAESLGVLEGTIIFEKNDNKATRKSFVIETARRHHGNAIVQLKGVYDRTAAEQLKGYTLFIERQELPEPDEEEIYLADIMGLTVFVQQEDTAPPVLLGTITDIDSPAGQELWTIETPEGTEVLLPAVPEFVLDINLDDEQVLIAPPPGLLDLYLKP